MNIVTKLNEWQTIRETLSAKSIGFVATMGNLHRGHMSLCASSKAQNDLTVVSIFVNPTQFNDANDFAKYPRTLAQDQAHLIDAKVDYLLLPEKEDLYRDGYQFEIHEKELSLELEGANRPGHFTGMLTVVLKLLNLVRPQYAYFGEKDFQQLQLINKMVKALFLPVKIVPGPTIRDADGLALSSRNSRLTQDTRKKAAHFPRLLHSGKTLQGIHNDLIALGFKIDYIAEKWSRRLGAVWLDDVRLIDNFPQGAS